MNESDSSSVGSNTTTSTGVIGSSYGAIGGDSISQQEEGREMRSTLTILHKIGFGLGHVYNDLCAGVWFSYTLVFLKGILQMDGVEAGVLVAWGQIVDAISTPICGVITDKYGTKRRWHIFGNFLVLLSFPAIFSICPWCDIAPDWWTGIYYALVVALFQFAWPLVQIANLSMIPELSKTQKDRSDLTAYRYSASVVASVIVYVVTWIIIRSRNVDEKQLQPSDWFRFRDISLILSLIGISMTVLYHFSLSLSNYEQRRVMSIQQRRTSESTSDTTPLLPERAARRRDYLKSPLLYQNALLYVFSRLFMTSSLLYMPLWLDERNKTPVRFYDDPDNIPEKAVEHLATVPLVSFVASFVASILMKMTRRCMGNQVSYLIGSSIGVAASAWVALATPISASNFQLFAVAILFGAGSSITMISSLSITADMIGPHASLGGFVYSAVTFLDKLVTGFVVVIIEKVKCQDCLEYYKFVLAYACGIAAILGIITLASLKITKSCTRPVNLLLVN